MWFRCRRARDPLQRWRDADSTQPRKLRSLLTKVRLCVVPALGLLVGPCFACSLPGFASTSCLSIMCCHFAFQTKYRNRLWLLSLFASLLFLQLPRRVALGVHFAVSHAIFTSPITTGPAPVALIPVVMEAKMKYLTEGISPRQDAASACRAEEWFVLAVQQLNSFYRDREVREP